MSAPTDDTTTTAWPNTEALLEQYEHWLTLPNIERDEYSAFAKLAALYRFAITHQDSPGNEMLFDAIAHVEDTRNK
ncbi:hypothetical protein [Mycolicibacterium sp.]|uniref:hypothetical protein n=1 Tax=Mycolicibacterium sp. TaxID=2320850 RepID=UPI0037C98883